MNQRSKFYSKIILITSGILLLISFVTLLIGEAPSGYEISIYQGTSSIVWITLAGAFCLLFVAPLIGRWERDVYYWGGIAASTIAYLYLIPWIRMYYLFLGGDAMTHVGTIRDIIEHGLIRSNNVYPAFHVYVTQFSMITGLGVVESLILVSLAFALTAYVSVIAVLNIFTIHHRYKLLAIVTSVLLFSPAATTNTSPWAQTSGLLLLALFLVLVDIRNGSDQLRITGLILIFLLGLLYLHPISVVLLIVLLVVVVPIGGLWRTRVDNSLSGPILWRLIRLVAYASVITISWIIFTNRLLFATLSTIFGTVGVQTSIPSAQRQSFLEEVVQVLADHSPRIIDLVELGLFRYGKAAALLGGATVAIFLYGSVARTRDWPNYYLLIVSPIWVFGGLAFVSIMAPLPIGFGRILFIAIILSIISIGIEFGNLEKVTDFPLSKKVGTSGLILLVTLLILTVPITTYQSTHNKRPNKQITAMEVEGMEWFIEHRQTADDVYNIGINPRRFGTMLQGRDSTVYGQLTPRRLGYTNSSSSWHDDAQQAYLIIAEQGKLTYPSFYPDYRDEWAFAPENFHHLNYDSSASRVYNNGELEIYRG